MKGHKKAKGQLVQERQQLRLQVERPERPAKNAIGQISKAISLSQSVTERKRAETALQASEERHRELYNKTPIMMHSIDDEGSLVSVNDYWLQVLGYKRSEVLGRKVPDFLTEASRRYALEVAIPRLRY